MRPLFTALFALFTATSLPGATSTAWDTSGFAEILKGRLQGLSLSADGVLRPGPTERWAATLGQPALWSIAAAPDGSTYAATGHTGEVFRIDRNGHATSIWRSEQPEIFAITVDTKGRVYAGTSPNGGLYRIESGKAQEIWHSPMKYIWSLQLGSDGSIYAGTGETGRIYRIDLNGKADVFYETQQGNVTALALAQNGHLLAGTDPNGLLYDIAGPGRATILYDSSLPEIGAIVAAPDGSVYAAALGGALSTRTGATAAAATGAASTVVSATPTVITVTEAHESGAAKPPTQNEQTSVRTPSVSTATTPAATTTAAATAPVTEVAGVEKSAIYLIAPDRTVTTLRSSKDDNVYDLLLSNGSLLFSTDDHGRVYQLDGFKITLLLESGEREATRLLQSGRVLYSAQSNPARLLAFDPDTRGPASYQSPVHDSGAVARWGHLQWRLLSGSGLRFQTRTGNSARPDDTWSPWSSPLDDPQHSLITSPIARFIQWRGEWPAGSNAACSSISVPYLPQNNAPTVRSITLSSTLGTNPAKATATAASSASAYSVTVTDTGEAPAASTTTGVSQVVSRLQSTQTQVTWQADDSDGDKLVYALYFRPEEATDWQMIRSRMTENSLLLDPDVFADGHYLFRVVASDSAANAPAYARQSELVSTSVLIDNTPPLVTVDAPHREGAMADVDVSAKDQTSPLRRCEYSLDAGFWQPIEASDGITDSPQERFHIHLEKLRPGEHLLVVRVYDSVGNAGLARVLLH